ncbi:MAG: hypothetical protein ACM3ML_22945 [Micromonosporaceae bacterium]
MASTIPSAALVPITPVFTNTERLAPAVFLAGYSGLTRQAYELDLRQYASWWNPGQRVRQVNPRPAALSVSDAQYHPYVASSTARGRSAARPIARRSSAGLLLIRVVSSFLPSALSGPEPIAVPGPQVAPRHPLRSRALVQGGGGRARGEPTAAPHQAPEAWRNAGVGTPAPFRNQTGEPQSVLPAVFWMYLQPSTGL